MRLQADPRLPNDPTPSRDWLSRLSLQLTVLFRDFSSQVNDLTEGRINAITNAYTTYPTTGPWNQGDYIANSAPTEAGTAGSKYVVMGWKCVASGTPGTWVQCRALTGN